MVKSKRHTEEKKEGSAKRILRGIGLGILTFIILLALVFEVSLKIIILLVIILAAFTALPKPARKWFWLGVSVVVLILTVWIFLPEDKWSWRPYTLDRELAAHESKYAIAGDENAAVVYDELVRDFVPQKMALKFLHRQVYRKVISGSWHSADYPELTRWLSEHENIIRDLFQACRFKKCRFPSSYKLRVTDIVERNRYTALKSWAVLLLLSANNDIAEGRLDQGLLKYVCALRIADHLYQQKRMVDFLLSFSIEGIAVAPISSFIIEGQISNEQLGIVTDGLTNLRNDWSSDFLQCLDYDKFFVQNTFCSLVFERNIQNEVRFSRNPADAIWGRFRRRAFEETYWYKKSMKASAILAWFVFPATPRKAAEMIDDIYEEYYAMAQSDYDWDNQAIGPPPSLELNCRFLTWLLTKRISQNYSGFRDIYLKRLAQRRGLRLLIAIKQYHNTHGSWPESLEEICEYIPPETFLDPTNDGGYVYVSEGGDFVLYSKGLNGLDENGQDKDGADDWFIWPLGE